MTQNQIADIKKVVSDYKVKKSEMLKQKSEIEKLHKEGRIRDYTKDIQIENLWKDLVATPERKKFCEYAQKTETDEDYEKYFRAIFSEVFMGGPLDPKSL